MRVDDDDDDLPDDTVLDTDAAAGEEGLDDLLDGDDGADDDDDEEDESEDDDSDGDGAEEGGGPKKVATKSKAKTDEDEPPGPDVPAPPLKSLRKALELAFKDQKDVGEELLDRYAKHAHLLLDHNRKVNLTAILDPADVAAQHYYDSWQLTQYYSFVGRRVVDLGTGGGFPGIPLALAEPNGSFVFIDSTKKKVDFVQSCIDELGIKNATAHWGRAEDWLARERCDVVLIRAVSSVRENVRTLRKVRHSLKELIMYKGPSWSREVRAGEREAERLGFHMNTVWEYELPDEQGKRAILVYQAPGGQGI